MPRGLYKRKKRPPRKLTQIVPIEDEPVLTEEDFKYVVYAEDYLKLGLNSEVDDDDDLSWAGYDPVVHKNPNRVKIWSIKLTKLIYNYPTESWRGFTEAEYLKAIRLFPELSQTKLKLALTKLPRHYHDGVGYIRAKDVAHAIRWVRYGLI